MYYKDVHYAAACGVMHMTAWCVTCTQGLCRMTSAEFKDPLQAVRLLMHECERVLSDRLVSDTDLAKFSALSVDVTRKHFSGMALVRSLRTLRQAMWVLSHQTIKEVSRTNATKQLDCGPASHSMQPTVSDGVGRNL